MRQRLRIDLEIEAAQSPLTVGKGPLDNQDKVIFGKWLQGKDAHSGQEGGDHLKGGILRCGADEGDQAALHVGEECVLLGLVKTVDLVHKEDRLSPLLAPLLGSLLDDAPDLLHSGEDRGKADEAGFCLLGQDPGKRRLPRTGRPPEDDGKYPVLTDGPPEETIRTEKVTLAHIFIEAPGPHPIGQRPVVALILLIKKIHLYPYVAVFLRSPNKPTSCHSFSVRRRFTASTRSIRVVIRSFGIWPQKRSQSSFVKVSRR